MYCTYITKYSGTIIPPYYLGSTSLKKIKKGYNGSVMSKKYKEKYDLEQKK